MEHLLRNTMKLFQWDKEIIQLWRKEDEKHKNHLLFFVSVFATILICIRKID